MDSVCLKNILIKRSKRICNGEPGLVIFVTGTPFAVGAMVAMYEKETVMLWKVVITAPFYFGFA